LSKAAKITRQAIRLVDGAVNAAVLVIILSLVSIGSFALWDSDQVHRAAAASNYAIYKPIPEAKSFDELILINDDVFAWIEVYGTHIDYPVVQGKDNLRYINTNAEGKYSLSGAIFLDYRAARDFSDFNSVLYGHHMEKFAMFGEIGDFATKSFFDERPHGMIFFDGREHGLEFFAFIHADAYDKTIFVPGVNVAVESQAYLDRIYELAVHTRALRVPVSVDDRIVLLNTCSSGSTNGRDILIGRITDEVFDNPFKVEETIEDSIVPAGMLDMWSAIPLWMKVLVIVLPLAALILLVSFLIRRKRNKNKAALLSSTGSANIPDEGAGPPGLGLLAEPVDDDATAETEHNDETTMKSEYEKVYEHELSGNGEGEN